MDSGGAAPLFSIDLNGKDDDSTSHDHDLLPTVEDIRAFIAQRSAKGSGDSVLAANEVTNHDHDLWDETAMLSNDAWASQGAPPRSRKRFLRILYGLSMLGGTMILIIVLCVLLLKPLEEPLPTHIATPSTTTRETRLNEVIEFLAESGLSSSAAPATSALTTDATPQQRAAVWIADLDQRNLPMYPEDDFIQRYVLAVFYYAVGGDTTFPQDIGFLSEQHECSWNKQEHEHTVGTTCNEQMQINGLHFHNNMVLGPLPDELTELRHLIGFQIYYD